MPASDVRRGRGPWPSDNGLKAVQHWLEGRLKHVLADGNERLALVRLMLDECSSLSRADRIIQNWQARESELESLSIWADRFAEGEPWQYIVGHSFFGGLKLKCDPRALIPRPETEELIHQALSLISGENDAKRILDIGTGTGCMALAWKQARPQDHVLGMDVSSAALELAKENALIHGDQDVDWIEMDILDPASDWPNRPFDLIMSNPPYIAWRELPSMEPRVHQWEPHEALFVTDEDPLIFYKQIVKLGAGDSWLNPAGWLCFECHAELTTDVQGLFERQAGWMRAEAVADLQGKMRMVLAQKRPVEHS